MTGRPRQDLRQDPLSSASVERPSWVVGNTWPTGQLNTLLQTPVLTSIFGRQEVFEKELPIFE